MRNSTRVTLALAGTTALLGTFALPASAADTTTTVAIEAGTISITAPAAFDLGVVTPGLTTTATTGDIAVIDERAGTAGWIATVSISDFTGAAVVTPANTIAATNVGYTPANAVVTGTATVTAQAQSDISTAVPVQSAASVTGNNSATWNATVAVAAPVDALADTYSAVITHSAS